MGLVHLVHRQELRDELLLHWLLHHHLVHLECHRDSNIKIVSDPDPTFQIISDPDLVPAFHIISDPD